MTRPIDLVADVGEVLVTEDAIQAKIAELSGTSGQVVPVRGDGPVTASAISLSIEPGPPTFEESPEP